MISLYLLIATWSILQTADATSPVRPTGCSVNETYKCSWRCGENCPPGAIYHCPLQTSDNCVWGCYCDDGCLRVGDGGNCVKEADCPLEDQCPNPNEVYLQCGTSCPDTCSNYLNTTRICSKLCKPGCFCKPGYVRDDNEDCVKPDKCPCGPNEVYQKCIQPCPPDECALLGAIIFCPFLNASLCKAGCHCIDGYYRDVKGKCIKRDQCPCKGDPNAIYKDCPSACPATCRGSAPATCNKECVRAGCECRKGYVLNNDTGKCVKKEHCPKPPQCPAGEEYDECGTACPANCTNYGQPILCTDQCVAGCFCPEGQVRDYNGVCIDPKDCACGPNEVYQKCNPPCPPNECALLGTFFFCPFLNASLCKGGCHCIDGYYRDVNGNCIKRDQCPCKGDPNAIYKDCPSACPATCRGPAPATCNKECVTAGCECREGYVLNNDTGKCVKKEDCPKLGCGGDPKAVSNGCGSYCGQRCIDLTGPKACPLFCLANGCSCQEGFYYNGTRCVLPKDCPPEPIIEEDD